MTRFVTALATLFVLLASGAAFAAKIGVASVVTNSVQGSSPPRPLTVGTDVFSAEKIRTGDASAAQLLFLDSTSVNVGARSEITLDRFVYDPNRGTGNVVLTASKGAFRFITGSQNPTHYSIKTPVATIGVRGTIVDVRTGAIGGVNTTVVTLIEGKVLIKALSGKELVLDQVGMSYILKSDGTIQGPLKGNGAVAIFLKDPKLFDLPDNRLDMIDVLGHPRTGPSVGGGGGRFCTFNC
jgi:ferric-dicitrate binding protein FerR (iron transport regulator)